MCIIFTFNVFTIPVKTSAIGGVDDAIVVTTYGVIALSAAVLCYMGYTTTDNNAALALSGWISDTIDPYIQTGVDGVMSLPVHAKGLVDDISAKIQEWDRLSNISYKVTFPATKVSVSPNEKYYFGNSLDGFVSASNGSASIFVLNSSGVVVHVTGMSLWAGSKQFVHVSDSFVQWSYRNPDAGDFSMPVTRFTAIVGAFSSYMVSSVGFSGTIPGTSVDVPSTSIDKTGASAANYATNTYPVDSLTYDDRTAGAVMHDTPVTPNVSVPISTGNTGVSVQTGSIGADGAADSAAAAGAAAAAAAAAAGADAAAQAAAASAAAAAASVAAGASADTAADAADTAADAATSAAATAAAVGGGAVKLDFSPLYIDITKKFPFCLPFDLAASFESLNAPAAAPNWSINFDSSIFVGGGTMVIDFSKFEGWAKIIRWGITVAFIISLIILTRRFL